MTDRAEQTAIALDYWDNHCTKDVAQQYANIIRDAQANGMVGPASLLIGKGYNLAKYHKIPAPVVVAPKAEAQAKPAGKKKTKR